MSPAKGTTGAPPARLTQEDAERAVAVLESHQAQFQALQEQRELIAQAAAEATQARTTLDAWKKAAKGEEVLIPVGAGTFVKATVADAERVVAGVGAGLSVEDTVAKATARLEARMAELGEAEKRLATQAQRLIDEMQRIQTLLESAAARQG